jgi:hypothetical protein
MHAKSCTHNFNCSLTINPKQMTLSASRQLKASLGVSANAALNIPGPIGCPPIFALSFEINSDKA